MEFQDVMIALIRTLGLHQSDRTPCGQPVSVAESHAVLELGRESGLSQNALAARLRLEKSSVSRIVTALEKRGLVARKRNLKDSRIVSVYLTDDGRDAVANLAASRRTKFERILGAIPANERRLSSHPLTLSCRRFVKHRSDVAAAIACGAFSALLVTLPALADPTPSQSHQAQVEQHSKEVMPFDLNRTMHIFTPTNTGGVQIVMVHDGDPQQIALVRSHLRKEARAFARGDFRDPAAIHGKNMPGLSQLRAGAKRIADSYGAMPNGASITYKTSDPCLIAAIYHWFAAQVTIMAPMP